MLITGAESYIGTTIERYLNQWPKEYKVKTIDMRTEHWKEVDFSGFDVVFHVAGIAHSDAHDANDEQKDLYYRVNTDLAIQTAEKAKADGVSQFIFMSSIIVYGSGAPIGEKKVITKDSVPEPENYYGDSKLKAEEALIPLSDENFRVAIIRPPMVYGNGSKGNYPILAKYARKLPLFPKVSNERSMLYAGNLAAFVRCLVNNADAGIFYPQNAEYVCTTDMVATIARVHGHRIWLTRIFNPILKLMSKRSTLVNKAFGNLVYDKQLSIYPEDYQLYGYEDSIVYTEGLHR